MSKARDIIGKFLTFDSMFESGAEAISKDLLVEKAAADLTTKSGGRIIVELGDESDLSIRKVDPHTSQGYAVYKSDEEYQAWMKSSLHEPSDEEMMEAMNGTRT